jgi:hypothetical protein
VRTWGVDDIDTLSCLQLAARLVSLFANVGLYLLFRSGIS